MKSKTNQTVPRTLLFILYVLPWSSWFYDEVTIEGKLVDPGPPNSCIRHTHSLHYPCRLISPHHDDHLILVVALGEYFNNIIMVRKIRYIFFVVYIYNQLIYLIRICFTIILLFGFGFKNEIYDGNISQHFKNFLTFISKFKIYPCNSLHYCFKSLLCLERYICHLSWSLMLSNT